MDTRTTGQRLKHLVIEVRQGWSPQCYPWPADGVGTWGVLKAGAANGGVFRATENKQLPADEMPRPELAISRGDLIISRANTRELLGSAAVVDHDYPKLMLCDKLYALKLDPLRADPRFVALTLGTRKWRGLIELESSGSSPSMQNISRSDIFNLPMDVPPVTEQRTIVDYLDRETARIDMLIEEQQRLIEMLRERRAAVIETSIAELDWQTPLGSVTRLIQTGPFGSQLKSDEYVEGGIPVINPSHLFAGLISPESRVAVDEAKAADLSRHFLCEGDVVVARRGELGRCAVVDDMSSGFICGTGSVLVRPDQGRLVPAFLALAFGSRRNKDALSLASVGSTMENLNAAIVSALRIPLPPVDDQRRIMAYVDGQTAKIDGLIAETEKFIELSRERGAALIAAAVTGQIDLQTEVA